MPLERDDRDLYRGHHFPNRPSTFPSQWNERHYQSYHTPYISPETAPSQRYMQDPHWGSGAYGNDTAGPEWRGEQERRGIHTHSQRHGHSGWKGHHSYSENGEELDYFDGRTFLPRVAREGDLFVDQDYAPTYESHSNPVSRRNGPNVSRGEQDEHAWSWDVRDGDQRVADEYSYRNAYRKEQRGHRMESSRVNNSSGHRETAEDEHGASHQSQCKEGVHHSAPRRHEKQLQGSPSEFEENLENMLPSQVDLYKGNSMEMK